MESFVCPGDKSVRLSKFCCSRSRGKAVGNEPSLWGSKRWAQLILSSLMLLRSFVGSNKVRVRFIGSSWFETLSKFELDIWSKFSAHGYECSTVTSWISLPSFLVWDLGNFRLLVEPRGRPGRLGVTEIASIMKTKAKDRILLASFSLTVCCNQKDDMTTSKLGVQGLD